MFEGFQYEQAVTCPAGSRRYTIQAGDTLYKIAQANRTSVDAIMALNPGLMPSALRVGQVICIPGAAPGICPGGRPYVIRSGDTFYLIASRNGISLTALLAANPGIDPSRLVVGQTICLPGSAPSEPIVPVTTPCAGVLQPVAANLPPDAEVPIGGYLVRAVAMNTRAFTVMASPLPEPGKSGNYNAYVAVVQYFREGDPRDVETINIRLVRSGFGDQPVVWAGSAYTIARPAAGETIEIRPLNTASGAQGPALLRGDLGNCRT